MNKNLEELKKELEEKKQELGNWVSEMHEKYGGERIIIDLSHNTLHQHGKVIGTKHTVEIKLFYKPKYYNYEINTS